MFSDGTFALYRDKRKEEQLHKLYTQRAIDSGRSYGLTGARSNLKSTPPASDSDDEEEERKDDIIVTTKETVTNMHTKDNDFIEPSIENNDTSEMTGVTTTTRLTLASVGKESKVPLDDYVEDEMYEYAQMLRIPDRKLPDTQDEYLPWTEKYPPRSRSEFVGNEKGVQMIERWLMNHGQKIDGTKLGLIISGPPGCGKSTICTLLPELMNYRVQVFDNLTPVMGKVTDHKSAGGNPNRESSLLIDCVIPSMVRNTDFLEKDDDNIAGLSTTNASSKRHLVVIDQAEDVASAEQYKALWMLPPTVKQRVQKPLYGILQPSRLVATKSGRKKTVQEDGIVIARDMNNYYWPAPLILTVNDFYATAIRGLRDATVRSVVTEANDISKNSGNQSEKPPQHSNPKEWKKNNNSFQKKKKAEPLLEMVTFYRPRSSDIVKRLKQICQLENVMVSVGGKDPLYTLADAAYGDVRKAIILLQTACSYARYEDEKSNKVSRTHQYKRRRGLFQSDCEKAIRVCGYQVRDKQLREKGKLFLNGKLCLNGQPFEIHDDEEDRVLIQDTSAADVFQNLYKFPERGYSYLTELYQNHSSGYLLSTLHTQIPLNIWKFSGWQTHPLVKHSVSTPLHWSPEEFLRDTDSESVAFQNSDDDSNGSSKNSKQKLYRNNNSVSLKEHGCDVLDALSDIYDNWSIGDLHYTNGAFRENELHPYYTHHTFTMPSLLARLPVYNAPNRKKWNGQDYQRVKPIMHNDEIRDDYGKSNTIWFREVKMNQLKITFGSIPSQDMNLLAQFFADLTDRMQTVQSVEESLFSMHSVLRKVVNRDNLQDMNGNPQLFTTKLMHLSKISRSSSSASELVEEIQRDYKLLTESPLQENNGKEDQIEITRTARHIRESLVNIEWIGKSKRSVEQRQNKPTLCPVSDINSRPSQSSKKTWFLDLEDPFIRNMLLDRFIDDVARSETWVQADKIHQLFTTSEFSRVVDDVTDKLREKSDIVMDDVLPRRERTSAIDDAMYLAHTLIDATTFYRKRKYDGSEWENTPSSGRIPVSNSESILKQKNDNQSDEPDENVVHSSIEKKRKTNQSKKDDTVLDLTDQLQQRMKYALERLAELLAMMRITHNDLRNLDLFVWKDLRSGRASANVEILSLRLQKLPPLYKILKHVWEGKLNPKGIYTIRPLGKIDKLVSEHKVHEMMLENGKSAFSKKSIPIRKPINTQLIVEAFTKYTLDL